MWRHKTSVCVSPHDMKFGCVYPHTHNVKFFLAKSPVGRAMAQAASRRPLTAEARLRSRVSPCGICGGQSGTGAGFSPSTSVFPCQFHSTGAPLQGKTKKLIIFITGLHNKPKNCGASVASTAGPFTPPPPKKYSPVNHSCTNDYCQRH
jgi:hypothetical protein